VLVAVAVGVLRSRVPEAAAEPVTEVPAEASRVRAIPLPADAVPGGGCVETGMRVVIGCGGCAGSS
jgi:hypothetical protein